MMPEYDFKNGDQGEHYQVYRKGHTVTVHQKDGTTQIQHFINAKDLRKTSHTNWKALASDSVDRKLRLSQKILTLDPPELPLKRGTLTLKPPF